MQTITTTELRTKTSQLIAALLAGQHISIIHRSKMIGHIAPEVIKHEAAVMTKDRLEKLKKHINAFAPLRPVSYKERDRIYRKHLDEKYVKGIS